MQRVFVIDDDELMRELIARVINGPGVEVVQFADGADALTSIIAERPDLVVTDVRMPRLSGVEMLQRMRARALDVPAILVTGERDEDVLAEARRLGVLRVFHKPLGDRGTYALRAAVECALSQDVIRHAGLEREAERAQLLTELSHQIRTPLTSMKLAIEGLFEQIDDALDPSQRHLCEITRRSVDRLIEVVEMRLRSVDSPLDPVEPDPLATPETAPAGARRLS